MLAKDYLSNIKWVNYNIQSKLQQIDDLRNMRITAKLNDIPFSNSFGHSKVESAVLSILDLEEEIDQKVDELVEYKKAVLEMINKLNNKELMLILELRYIQGYKFDKIAEIMNYDRRQISRLHNRALDKFQKILDREYN